METVSREYRIHYLTSGSRTPLLPGPALIVIPGFTASAKDCEDAGYIERFSDGYRVVVVDPLGHGESDKPHEADSYLPAEVAKDVVAVLDSAGIDRAHVWGYSRGGNIAAMVATLFPDRVQSLIAGGAMIMSDPRGDADFEDWARRTAETLRSRDWDAFWRQLNFPMDDGLKQLTQARNDPLVLAAEMEATLLPGPSVDLTEFGGAKLVYAGSREPELALMRVDADAAGARFEVIQGADHTRAFRDLDLVAPLVRQHVDSAA